MSSSRRIPDWLWILAAILVVRLVLMATFPLTDNSEPRYAEIARIMAETGDWITPWFEPGIPFWGKPPLAFWASALSFRLLGYSDFAARLPALLATIAILLLIHDFARSQFNGKVARLAVLIYATSFLAFLASGAVLTDTYLTLAVTLSLVAFGKLAQSPHPAWKYAFFVGLALGMLAKGPLAIVLIFGTLLPWVLWHRTSKEYLRCLPWKSGILLFFAMSAPWYVLAELKTPGFLEYFIVGEHFHRFIDPGWQGDLYGSAHKRAYGSIWLDWLLATFPWGLLALWQLVRWAMMPGNRLREALCRHADPRTTYLLLWTIITPAFFTFSGNILWTYIQPSLPGFSILLAVGLLNRQASAGARPLWKTLMALTPGAGILIGSLAMAYPQQVRTEKHLISYYADHAHPDQPLYYLGRRPFSARYYSHEQARSYPDQNPSEALDQYPSGIYLAVAHDRLATLEGLAVSPVLFKNRRYSLVFVKKNSEQSSFLMGAHK